MRGLRHDYHAASRAILPALESWLEKNPAVRTIATYAALPGELDVSEIVSCHPERRWVYPRVVGDDLHFHHVLGQERDMRAGKFGILEPTPELPRLEMWEIDVFFCPGLAFDSRGGRLGRGRGFYDRALAQARHDALKIGICGAAQRVPDTFSEAHDIQMDEVISG